MYENNTICIKIIQILLNHMSYNDTICIKIIHFIILQRFFLDLEKKRSPDNF